MVTENEIRAYFANPNQSNNIGWVEIRRLAILHLKKQGLKTIEICDIVGVGRKSVWEQLKKKQSKPTINFEDTIKRKLYPKTNKVTTAFFK
jgi:hypothetical protein